MMKKAAFYDRYKVVSKRAWTHMSRNFVLKNRYDKTFDLQNNVMAICLLLGLGIDFQIVVQSICQGSDALNKKAS